jgi:hypothetical protein
MSLYAVTLSLVYLPKPRHKASEGEFGDDPFL